MSQVPSPTNHSISALDHFPLLGYPEFSQGLQNHIRILRLLGNGFLMLGFLLIASTMVYGCLHQPF